MEWNLANEPLIERSRKMKVPRRRHLNFSFSDAKSFVDMSGWIFWYYYVYFCYTKKLILYYVFIEISRFLFWKLVCYTKNQIIYQLLVYFSFNQCSHYFFQIPERKVLAPIGPLEGWVRQTQEMSLILEFYLFLLSVICNIY